MSANQSFARLSHTVRSIAVGVGVMAGVGIPASFGLVAYQDQVSNLSYRTELAAERLAEYIYVQGDDLALQREPHRRHDRLHPHRRAPDRL